MRNLLFLFSVFVAIPALSRSTALVINFGGAYMDGLTVGYFEAYREHGIEVLTVDPQQPIYPQLESLFATLAETDVLHVHLLGHGQLADAPSDLSGNRFLPAIISKPYVLTERIPLEVVLTPQIFVFSSESTKNVQPDLLHGDSVGVGDFVRWFKAYLARSPNTKIHVNLLHCYGGVPAMQLSQIPNVYVFSSAPDVDVGILAAWDGLAGQYVGTAQYWIQSLRSDSPRTPIFHRFQSGRRKWLEKAVSLRVSEAFSVSRSAVDTIAYDWCARNTAAQDIIELGRNSSAKELSGHMDLTRWLLEDTLAAEAFVQRTLEKDHCHGFNPAIEKDETFLKISANLIALLQNIHHQIPLHQRAHSVRMQMVNKGILSGVPVTFADSLVAHREVGEWIQKEIIKPCEWSRRPEVCLETNLYQRYDQLLLFFDQQLDFRVFQDCQVDHSQCLAAIEGASRKNVRTTLTLIKKYFPLMRKRIRICNDRGEYAYARGCFRKFLDEADGETRERAADAARWMMRPIQ